MIREAFAAPEWREMEKEFARFVREFELEAGMGVSIEGNAALDVVIPDEIMEEFRAFDSFLEEESIDRKVKEDKQLTQHVSRTLSGEGYGKTEKEAKKEALADLSSAIQAEVQSEFKSIVTVPTDMTEIRNFTSYQRTLKALSCRRGP